MLRKTFVALIAGSGVVFAAPATSARPDGGIWAKAPKASSSTNAKAKSEDSKAEDAQADVQAGTDASAPVKADANGDEAVAKADLNANANPDAAVKSQGTESANVNAVERADANSALAAGAVAGTALPGLTTGLDVKTSAGATVGKVSEVVTGTDGSIRMVVVTDASGKTHRLMANQLSISGGVVTTTQSDIGG